MKINPADYPDWVYNSLKKQAKSVNELEDLLYQWDERCGIMHYEGGVPMNEAEKDALKEVLARLGTIDQINEKEL